jgi:hypothetical protein
MQDDSVPEKYQCEVEDCEQIQAYRGKCVDHFASRKWWFHFPNQVYANDFTFMEPVTQQEAIEYVEWWLGHSKAKPDQRVDLSEDTSYWPR